MSSGLARAKITEQNAAGEKGGSISSVQRLLGIERSTKYKQGTPQPLRLLPRLLQEFGVEGKEFGF